MKFVTLLVAAVAVLVQVPSPSQPPPPGYVAYRTTASVWVDGQLDDVAWKSAPWTDAFVDIEGDAKPRPRYETRVKMLWDQIYLYIGAELSEPHLWGTLTEHDSVIFRDNDFEVFIDPNGDNHEYYELEVNALGTTWDLLLPKPYRDDGKPVNGWEIAGLKSAVHMNGTLNNPADTDRGWTVELAVPWKALGELARCPSPPRDADQWRVNFSRVEWQLRAAGNGYEKVPNTPENNWVWSPQGAVDMHRPERWGYVQFSTAAPGTAAFVPDPAREARDFLQAVYYAEREYKKAHGRWAASFAELGRLAPDMPADVEKPRIFSPTIQVAGSGFEASVSQRLARDTSERWHIRQDSLIWKE